MKTIKRLFGKMIKNFDDESGIGDGYWIYLKDEYADFMFDPQQPSRMIHEWTVKRVIWRFSGGGVRKITEADYKKFPHLRK